ncbi:hypothetical protein, partial [Mycobacterium tuberculosis]
EVRVLEEVIVTTNSVSIDNTGKVTVEFQCITGESVSPQYVNVEIDSSLNDLIEVRYLIPKFTYDFVSYWDQKKKRTIERYEKNLHGVRLRMSEDSYRNFLNE